MASTRSEATIRVVTEMSPGMEQLLTQIRDRLPASEPVAAAAEPIVTKGSELSSVKRAALGAVLDALDGWIEAARENHKAMEHRGENVGDECWRRFAPSDVRDMVDDAARALGVTRFPHPALPLEDRK